MSIDDGVELFLSIGATFKHSLSQTRKLSSKRTTLFNPTLGVCFFSKITIFILRHTVYEIYTISYVLLISPARPLPRERGGSGGRTREREEEGGTQKGRLTGVGHIQKLLREKHVSRLENVICVGTDLGLRG